MSNTSQPKTAKNRRWLLVMLIAGALLLPGRAGILPTSAETPAEEGSPFYRLAVGQPMRMVDAVLNGRVFRLEEAVTPEEQMRGLMFRTSLPEDRGMLFRFSPARPVHFWMKNTRIPLDMIFIRNHRVVHVQHSAPPCKQAECPQYGSTAVVDSVIELAGGTARKYGITDGVTATVLTGHEKASTQTGN